jgi:hypothetical protein
VVLLYVVICDTELPLARVMSLLYGRSRPVGLFVSLTTNSVE